jgi:hypothetical protein
MLGSGVRSWNVGFQKMTRDFAPGNYRFIPAVFQYSSGAMADPGYEIERVRFDRLLPLADGFAQIAKYMQAAGRPNTSFCACELRSPAAFTEEGFRAFNLHYVKTLGEWGLCDGTTNSVARSNVCPEIDPPSEPSFYAFSFTRPSQNKTPTFVIAGGAEARGGSGSYPERIVRYRDLSLEGMKEKVRFTTAEMERRMEAFGVGWKDTTGVQAYSIRDFHSALPDELVRRGAARSGLTWHFARPPVIDLEYEMDCRRVIREVVI